MTGRKYFIYFILLSIIVVHSFALFWNLQAFLSFLVYITITRSSPVTRNWLNIKRSQPQLFKIFTKLILMIHIALLFAQIPYSSFNYLTTDLKQVAKVEKVSAKAVPNVTEKFFVTTSKVSRSRPSADLLVVEESSVSLLVRNPYLFLFS